MWCVFGAPFLPPPHTEFRPTLPPSPSPSPQGRNGLFKTIMNKVIQQIQDAVSDYGPPYEYDEYFEGALLFETSQPNCSASAVHGLLNCKVDPNDVDKEDLNFTPMHYCARYCHLAAMRMLVKAKAYVNVLNEFGQTPLTVCVLVKQSPNNVRNQIVMTEFLLDNGAYVDVRDKVGMGVKWLVGPTPTLPPPPPPRAET